MRLTSSNSETPSVHPKKKGDRPTPLFTFWQFCRPHTVIGTTLSVVGLYLVAFAQTAPIPLTSLVLALLACLCGNIYIVGLNQLEDVAIDQINKPHLPLAAENLSRRQAEAIVVVTGILALCLAASQSPALFVTVGLSLLIGTVYSLPPLRLKRFPILAALCIFTVRGVIVNLGLYLHFRGGVEIPVHLWALTLFVVGFTVAIALFKDIPDTAGDRQYQINTFTLQMGQRRVFSLAIGLLIASYLGMVGVGLSGLPEVHQPSFIATHLFAAILLWFQSRRVDLQSQSEISQCYQFIWKLFYLEYLLFPVTCLLAKSF
jgi:homogentisate phytyltransferase/homogentisate geranylgeranyltransferase